METPGPLNAAGLAADLEAALAEGFGLLDLMTASGPADGSTPDAFRARVDAVLTTLWRAEMLFAELGAEPLAPVPDPPSPSCHARTTARPRRCRRPSPQAR